MIEVKTNPKVVFCPVCGLKLVINKEEKDIYFCVSCCKDYKITVEEV